VARGSSAGAAGARVRRYPASKFATPKGPVRLVHRSRLFEQLDRGADVQLTLVVGSPGAGKTAPRLVDHLISASTSYVSTDNLRALVTAGLESRRLTRLSTARTTVAALVDPLTDAEIRVAREAAAAPHVPRHGVRPAPVAKHGENPSSPQLYEARCDLAVRGHQKSDLVGSPVMLLSLHTLFALAPPPTMTPKLELSHVAVQGAPYQDVQILRRSEHFPAVPDLEFERYEGSALKSY
jgi:hypothetical protein